MNITSQNIRRAALSGLGLALVAASLAAQAGVVLQAATASTTLGTQSGSVAELINQSGLIAASNTTPLGYVSGVTDFDGYIAQGPRHDNFAFTTWASDLGTTSGSIVFGLGGASNIEAFALWSRGVNQQGVREFDLYIADDAGFSTSTLLGSFTAAQQNNPGGNAAAQVFGFAATTGSFVRMDVRSVYGSCCITMSEVAFEANPLSVPEPGSLLLGATALAISGLRRRKAPARPAEFT